MCRLLRPRSNCVASSKDTTPSISCEPPWDSSALGFSSYPSFFILTWWRETAWRETRAALRWLEEHRGGSAGVFERVAYLLGWPAPHSDRWVRFGYNAGGGRRCAEKLGIREPWWRLGSTRPFFQGSRSWRAVDPGRLRCDGDKDAERAMHVSKHAIPTRGSAARHLVG